MNPPTSRNSTVPVDTTLKRFSILSSDDTPRLSLLEASSSKSKCDTRRMDISSITNGPDSEILPSGLQGTLSSSHGSEQKVNSSGIMFNNHSNNKYNDFNKILSSEDNFCNYKVHTSDNNNNSSHSNIKSDPLIDSTGKRSCHTKPVGANKYGVKKHHKSQASRGKQDAILSGISSGSSPVLLGSDIKLPKPAILTSLSSSLSGLAERSSHFSEQTPLPSLSSFTAITSLPQLSQSSTKPPSLSLCLPSPPPSSLNSSAPSTPSTPSTPSCEKPKRRRKTYVVPHMSDSARQKKQRDALEAYNYWKSGKSSLRQAAAKFNVDKNMIVRAPTLGKKSHSRRFFENTEEDDIENIITHIVSVERYGLSRLICETAKLVLRDKEKTKKKKKKGSGAKSSEQGFAEDYNDSNDSNEGASSSALTTRGSSGPVPDLSRGWAKRFIERHPHIGRGVILSAKESKDKNLAFSITQAWFSIYLTAVQYFGISPSNIYSVGQVSMSDIFQDTTHFADKSQEEIPTVLETISGDGAFLPSYVILGSSSAIPNEQSKSMDGVSFSPHPLSNGPLFNNLSLDFLINHFDSQTLHKSGNGKLPRGIIIDGSNKFTSTLNVAGGEDLDSDTSTPNGNTNFEFFIEAAKRNIVVFILPVLPGHERLKPFNQSRVINVIKEEIQNPLIKQEHSHYPDTPSHFNSSDLFHMLDIYTKAKSRITEADVKVGFSQSGLIPFSPCEVNNLLVSQYDGYPFMKKFLSSSSALAEFDIIQNNNVNDPCNDRNNNNNNTDINNDLPTTTILTKFPTIEQWSDKSDISDAPNTYNNEHCIFSNNNDNQHSGNRQQQLTTTHDHNNSYKNQHQQQKSQEYSTTGKEDKRPTFLNLLNTCNACGMSQEKPRKNEDVKPFRNQISSILNHSNSSTELLSYSISDTSRNSSEIVDSESPTDGSSPSSISSCSTSYQSSVLSGFTAFGPSVSPSPPACPMSCENLSNSWSARVKPLQKIAPAPYPNSSKIMPLKQSVSSKSNQNSSVSLNLATSASSSYLSPTIFPVLPPLPYPFETTSLAVPGLDGDVATVDILKPESIAPFSYESAVKRIGTTLTSFSQIFEQYARIKWTLQEFKDSFKNNQEV